MDILLICETKLDDVFLSAQFKIDEFSAPFRFDRSNKRVGLLMYIREDIPSHQLFACGNVTLRLYQLKSS